MKALAFIVLAGCSHRGIDCRTLAAKHVDDVDELGRQAKTGKVKFKLLLDIQVEAKSLERCIRDLD